jgi:cation transport protein ChaC
MAYHIHEKDAEKVLNHLNLREMNGYSLLKTTVYHPHRPAIPHALVYIGLSDNSEFLGPCSIQEMAHQIAFTKGPSGPNSEYLLELAAALKEIAPDHPEPHIYDLASVVQNLKNQPRQVV